MVAIHGPGGTSTARKINVDDLGGLILNGRLVACSTRNIT